MPIFVEFEGIVLPPVQQELVKVLAELGYEARSRPGVEERSIPTAGWELLLWCRDHLAPPAALALATAVARWAEKRRRGREGRQRGTVKVFGPRGEVLAKVEVPDSDDDSEETGDSSDS